MALTNKENEVLLLIKSKSSLLEKIEKRVKMLHSYEVPEILIFKIDAGSQDYLGWIDNVLGK